MKNICVIGNSHISALKLGWDETKSNYPDVRMNFFGGPRDTMNDVVVANGKIVAANEKLRRYLVRTSGNLDSIDANYDEFLLCGLQFSILQMRKLIADYRAESHHVDDRAPVSDGCFFQSMLGGLREKLAMRILSMVRQISDAPIAVMHQPMPSMDDRKSPAAHLRDVGDDAKVSEVFLAASRKLSKEFNFSLYPQPEETLHTPLHTRRRFSKGAVRFRSMREEGDRETVAENDIHHMNTEYGIMLLRSYLGDGTTART